MNITMKELLNAKPSLEKILNKDLPMKISYKLSKLARKLDTELKFFDESRKKLFKKYSDDQKQENGQVEILDEYKETFEKEINDLLDLEIDLNQIQTVKLEDFPDNLELTPIDLMNLECFIEE